MDKNSELLIRSSLHDLANVLGGIRGIIDLSSPGEALSARDRNRLEAVVEEGLATLERTRNLAMGHVPEPVLEPGGPWRAQLLEQLAPMGVIFRSGFDLTCQGEALLDQWPGEPLRSYVRAVTRQVLPYVRTGHLGIHLAARKEAWTVGWAGVAAIPDNLLPANEDRPKDIASRWAAQVASALNITLALEGGFLVARVPRP
jgi:transcriptional regulator of nitric oxide reductase